MALKAVLSLFKCNRNYYKVLHYSTTIFTSKFTLSPVSTQPVSLQRSGTRDAQALQSGKLTIVRILFIYYSADVFAVILLMAG